MMHVRLNIKNNLFIFLPVAYSLYSLHNSGLLLFPYMCNG